MSSRVGKWIETSRELVLKTGLFKIFSVGYRAEGSGNEGKFDVLEAKDWVNVVPVLKNGNLLLVEQFRFGVGEITLEFPAGQVESGQTPLSAARRELQEETGGVGETVEEIGQSYGNPAFLSNHCYHYVARGVELGHARELDEHEEIEYREASPVEVSEWIAAGRIKNPHSIASWYFFRQAK